jgi:hypothetical protein
VTDPERSVVVLDLGSDEDQDEPEDEDGPGRSVRALPYQVRRIGANLGISNTDFVDYAEEVGPDGVFRGLKR